MKVLRSIVWLLCSTILALAPWSQSLPTTDAMFVHPNYWVGLCIIAGVLLAFIGQSPIKPKK